MDAALDALGDASLGCNCFAAALAESFYKPVYYYRFDYDRNIGPHILGAAHGTELPFVFRNFDRSPYNLLYAAGDRESRDQLEEIISDYWVNFARTGDPNGKGLAECPRFEPADQGPDDPWTFRLGWRPTPVRNDAISGGPWI